MGNTLHQLDMMMCGDDFVGTMERPHADYTQAVYLYLATVDQWGKQAALAPKSPGEQG